MEETKDTMSAMSCPLCSFRQKRQRELQLGCRCVGHDARLCGDDDAVCTVYMLRRCRGSNRRVRAPDQLQDESGRRRDCEVNHDACRGVPVPYRGLGCLPGLFRLPGIGRSRLQGDPSNQILTN